MGNRLQRGVQNGRRRSYSTAEARSKTGGILSCAIVVVARLCELVIFLALQKKSRNCVAANLLRRLLLLIPPSCQNYISGLGVLVLILVMDGLKTVVGM